jgi:hypothetical protein|tara:strand:- start:87 stop:248 length:162 start_codon:yes stop_codon:yes gene_type:complete
MFMEDNNKKKIPKSRQERLKAALKVNVAKRKAQAKGRTQTISTKKSIELKLED